MAKTKGNGDEGEDVSDNQTTLYTAVFRVEGDSEKHNEWWRLMRSMKNPDTGITVVATASFDALAKLDEEEGESAW